jgi:hypothetical protein
LSLIFIFISLSIISSTIGILCEKQNCLDELKDHSFFSQSVSKKIFKSFQIYTSISFFFMYIKNPGEIL